MCRIVLLGSAPTFGAPTGLAGRAGTRWAIGGRGAPHLPDALIDGRRLRGAGGHGAALLADAGPAASFRGAGGRLPLPAAPRGGPVTRPRPPGRPPAARGSGRPPAAPAAAGSAAGRHRRRLALVLALTGGYLLVELLGGVLTGSLALLADAAHMGTDVFGLALALVAVWLGGRAPTPGRTYGAARAEILAAAVNAAVLFAVAGALLAEAWRRLQAPPEVQSLPMLAVAAVGLAVNLVGVGLLRGGAGESLNVAGAFQEVLADLLGSLAALAAGALMLLTGWWYADPLCSVAVALLVLPRTWRLLREAVHVLLEGTPAGVDLAEVRAALQAVPGVRAVHDLHVWSITSGYAALSAHVLLDGDPGGAERARLLSALGALLRERFGLAHTTLQLEDPGVEEAGPHA